MNKKNNFTAMILAAGYGTRLRPITDEIPKPLIPVGNRTLLENIMQNLSNAGIAKFAVNCHHLGDIISDAVENSSWDSSTVVLKEDEILGTGGPLVNARSVLSEGCGFLLHNGDILTDIDLSGLLECHKSSPDNLVTMVMIDGPENRVAVNSDSRIADILGKLGKEDGCRLYTYAGIACFSSEIFNYLPGKPVNCSIITAILNLMRDKPNAVAAYLPEKEFVWNDLGTVEKFVDTCSKSAGGAYSLNENLLPSLTAEKMIPMPMQLLRQQGSGRLFFRLNKQRECIEPAEAETKIIMCASADNSDFDSFLKIGKFLHKNKLGAPEIFTVNPDNHTVIMEDLGDDTLYNLVRSGNSSRVEELYRQVIRWLIEFQVNTYNKIIPYGEGDSDSEKLRLPLFDYDYLRWETNYFSDNFLKKYCEFSNSMILNLEDEFHTIAENALTSPQVMIHRDFQSQNILIHNCEVRIVDFQGARIGHIAYDLMSLLNDPYIALDKDLRLSLSEYFFNSIAETPLLEKLLEKKALRSITSIVQSAALQRGMQALGAYAFLSIEKGKTSYRKFIPPALKILNETLEDRDKYPNLKRVLKSLTHRFYAG
jgi:aminoglycoside/choline kinase family phosphotransferase/choline kinase